MSVQKQKKVVVIGGGTGSFTVLSGLKKYPLDLSAIVTMADDGGSTGRLRDEFGVLPPGDIRQCLVALSEASETLRAVFNHRFNSGELAGHSFGNLFISALEQVTGDLDHALDLVGDILKIRGKVIPVTLDKVTLTAELKNGKKLSGESQISDYQLVSRFGIKRIFLEPKAKANPKALHAIKEADVLIIGPGDLYCSLLPNFLVRGVAQAVKKSKGKKIYIVNLMNKYGHTDGFTAFDYVNVIEDKIGSHNIDIILFNCRKPAATLLRRYADEGEPVILPPTKNLRKRKIVSVNVLAEKIYKGNEADLLQRTLIRHDSHKLAKVIFSLI